MKELFIVRAEVIPLPNSLLFKEKPTVKGAFVDCIILAYNLDNAQKIAKDMLREDGYDFVQFTEAGKFDEFTFTNLDLETEYKELVRSVNESGESVYGTFHCYYND